jgi:hypothetical protein
VDNGPRVDFDGSLREGAIAFSKSDNSFQAESAVMSIHITFTNGYLCSLFSGIYKLNIKIGVNNFN